MRVQILLYCTNVKFVYYMCLCACLCVCGCARILHKCIICMSVYMRTDLQKGVLYMHPIFQLEGYIT